MLTHRTKIQKEWFLKCCILAPPSQRKMSFLSHFSVRKDTSAFLLLQLHLVWVSKVHRTIYHTIHFGPAKNVESYLQESGRAGGDGSQCTAYLLYQGVQLIHVDQDIKSYIKSNDCQRKQLLQYFDVDCSPQNPAHLCCDN